MAFLRGSGHGSKALEDINVVVPPATEPEPTRDDTRDEILIQFGAMQTSLANLELKFGELDARLTALDTAVQQSLRVEYALAEHTHGEIEQLQTELAGIGQRLDEFSEPEPTPEPEVPPKDTNPESTHWYFRRIPEE